MTKTAFSIQHSAFSIRGWTWGVLPVLFFIFYFSFSLLLLLVNDVAYAKDNDPGIREIKDIEIFDNAVKIKLNGPVKFRINKSDDPFRAVVDLEDTGLGKFKNRIFSYKAGITEVVPAQIEGPSKTARLGLLLQAPSEVRPEVKDNTLTLYIEHDGKPGIADSADPAGPDEVISLITDDKNVPEAFLQEFEGGDSPDEDTAEEITEIMFDKTERGVELIIRGDGPMPDPSVFDLEGKLIIDIPYVVMNATMPSKMEPPVKNMRYREEEDRVRFILGLEANANKAVSTLDDEVVVDFSSGLVQEQQVGAEGPVEATKPEKTKPARAGKKENGTKQSETKDQKSGIVSLDFQDADIIPILRLLSDVSGFNVVVHPDVKGKITMKLLNVPWEQALDMVLKTFTLNKVIDGNVIRIAPASVFAREQEENVKQKVAEMQSLSAETMGIIEPRVFPINYADVTLVEGTLKSAKVLSSRGNISADKRTSSIVVYDVPAIFPYIEKLLETLDKPTPQVLIEARIVEINTSDAVDLGIQWGLNFKPTTDLMSIGGFSGLGSGTFTGKKFLVDLPGSVGAGSGSGFTFGIINPARTMGLDLQLGALETVSKGKIISSPRIVTIDSEKAKIMQGTSEPFPQVSGTSGGISTSFKDVALTVEVTPHITPDGSVTMEISVVKEDILGQVNIGGSQVPRTSKVESKTKVLVQNGETIVIGGVHKKTETDADSGVPGLKNIPVLGWLFKNKSVSERTNELMIFITPRIIENSKSKKSE